ncbi:MAG TPA: DMT family transporter [Actinomycetota bacterium]|nr:DMT family transporter [Actinomycetota bacterium]
MSGVKVAIALSLVAGIAGALQAAFSGSLGRRVGSLEAAAFLGVLGALVLLAAAVWLRGAGGVVEGLRHPPWLWLGGAFGALVVFTLAFSPPRIGTFGTIALLVAGQLVAGALIDAFGLLGFERVPLSLGRLAGLGLLAAGAILVLRR